jgi:hypothetical protein
MIEENKPITAIPLPDTGGCLDRFDNLHENDPV